MNVVSEDGRFEWDEQKARRNIQVHEGVSFEEATYILDDPLAQKFFDEEHSNEEDRYIAVGHSNRGKLLVVCYTVRGERKRIISARKATRAEQRDYEEAL